MKFIKEPKKIKMVVSFRDSLAVTLSKFGVLIAFTFGILISTYQIVNDYISQEDELTQTVMQILQITESSVKQAVYEYDGVLADKVIKGLFAYKPIIQVTITDDFGEVLAKDTKDIDTHRQSWITDDFLSAHRQFQIDIITQDNLDKSNAKLIVIVDTYNSISAFFSRASIIFISGLVLNILLAFALLALFHYLVSKPLNHLILHLLAIDSEKPNNILTISSSHKNNEIGLLTQNINILLQSIINHIKEVEGLNENLEQRVEERTNELKIKSKESLESMELLKNTQLQLIEAEKNTALGGLVVGVAHEINTPLGVMVTATSSLKDECDNLIEKTQAGKVTRTGLKNSLEHINNCTEVILKNSARTSALITRFKEIAVNQETFEKKHFSIVKYIEDILVTLQWELHKTNVTVKVEYSADFEVNSYPGAIAQIISNLILNALLHAYDEQEEGIITIQILKLDDGAEINVTDDGKGIEKEKISQIFDPFYTTRRSADGHNGLGLGLHIINNIVTNTLQGKISCTSEPNKYTCFKLIFNEIFSTDQKPIEKE